MHETLARRQFGVGVVVATVTLAGYMDTGDGDGPVNSTNDTNDEPAVGGAEMTAETGDVGTTAEDST